MKRFFLTIICLICMLPVVYASEMYEKDNAVNWEISMMPKATAEEIEQSRWALILENDLGVYAYDRNTLGFLKDASGKLQPMFIEADIKTIFLNKEIIKQLNTRYSDKLKKKENFNYTQLHIIFNIDKDTYATTNVKAFSDKNKELENTDKKLNFVPVPPKTFAEAMMEICRGYAAEQFMAANEAAQQKK